MPPKKKSKDEGSKVPIPKFPPATSSYELNKGFRFSMADNPPNLGKVPIPEGKRGCLQGLTFVATGTMSSITRETLVEILEKYGARVTSSISGKTDIVIRGCIEVGPRKLSDAKERHLPIIDEEGLFSYLRSTNPEWEPPQQTPAGADAPSLSEIDFPVSSLLTEKYRPRSIKDLVGNWGAIQNLTNFFKDFDHKKDVARCALVCGPPGVGKSTSVSLIASSYGYRPIEFNASDSRSKKTIGEKLASSFTNRSINAVGTSDRTCLIFDEVDGMAAGDYGGLSELARRAQGSLVPMICICNDSDNKKMKPLADVSLIIKFASPANTEIADRLTFITQSEGIDVPMDVIEKIAAESNGDIRHAINSVQFWALSPTSPSQDSSKIVELSDITTAALSVIQPETTMDQRYDAFFVDSSIIPLYVYENLPSDYIEGYSEAMDSISYGDMIGSEIRGEGAWNLMVPQALMSCVIPGFASQAKKRPVYVKFPQYFSRQKRCDRIRNYYAEMAERVVSHVSSGSLYESYVPLVWKLISGMLKHKPPLPPNHVDEALKLLDNLGMNYSDFEGLQEASEFDIKSAQHKDIPPTNRTLLAKKYKQNHADAGATEKKKSKAARREDWLIKKRPTKGEVETEVEQKKVVEKTETESEEEK